MKKYKQSKKQNQRILQITESTLVVGAELPRKRMSPEPSITAESSSES
ncbi:hypothetical protein JCM16163A_38410 [Paenibacillus sp. YK5]